MIDFKYPKYCTSMFITEDSFSELPAHCLAVAFGICKLELAQIHITTHLNGVFDPMTITIGRGLLQRDECAPTNWIYPIPVNPIDFLHQVLDGFWYPTLNALQYEQVFADYVTTQLDVEGLTQTSADLPKLYTLGKGLMEKYLTAVDSTDVQISNYFETH